MVPFALTAAQQPTTARPLPAKRRRRRRNRGLAFFMVLALTATGAVFARTYLLETSWDAQARPYADAVEDARGVGPSEPVTVAELDGPSFAARSYQVLLGGQEDHLREGSARAMGLLEGTYDSLGAAGHLAEGRLALYDPTSRSILVDASVPDGPEREAAMVREMDVALADQVLAWSSGWSDLNGAERIVRRGFVDGAAVLLGERWLQETTTQTIVRNGVEPPMSWPRADSVVGVPDDVRLESSVVRSVGPWAASALGTDWSGDGRADGSTATQATSDAALWDPAVGLDMAQPANPSAGDRRGMGYWYLVLASRLDADQAWGAARWWADDSQEVTTRSGRVCVTSRVSTSGDIGVFVLGSALMQWAGAAPVEAATSVDVGDDGVIVVSSCDPGADVSTRSRTSGPSELVSFGIAGWHLARLIPEGAELSCVVAEANRSGTVSSLARVLRSVGASDRAGVLADPRWTEDAAVAATDC